MEISKIIDMYTHTSAYACGACAKLRFAGINVGFHFIPILIIYIVYILFHLEDKGKWDDKENGENGESSENRVNIAWFGDLGSNRAKGQGGTKF